VYFGAFDSLTPYAPKKSRYNRRARTAKQLNNNQTSTSNDGGVTYKRTKPWIMTDMPFPLKEMQRMMKLLAWNTHNKAHSRPDNQTP
jgi:hypothetical protein